MTPLARRNRTAKAAPRLPRLLQTPRRTAIRTSAVLVRRRDEIPPHRREDVEQNARLDVHRPMHRIRRNNKAVPRTKTLRPPGDRDVKHTALNQRTLNMRVTVRQTNRTTNKTYPNKHHLVAVGFGGPLAVSPSCNPEMAPVRVSTPLHSARSGALGRLAPPAGPPHAHAAPWQFHPPAFPVPPG